MAKIKTLKDYEQNTIYPVSTTQAVVNSEGINLDSIHSTFITAKQIEDIETGNIGVYELQGNKVTTVDAASTDTQYPTAKAVYDYGLAIKKVGIQMTKVDSLPAVEEAQSGLIYLIKNTTEENLNIYEEYILVDQDGLKSFEKIGDTTVDLTGYATETYVNNAIANAIKVQTISQEDYDALQSYDLNTLYVIE